jgi:hypothetical protein
VAGRDADYIVIDDLEERKTVATSDLRQKSREKHNEIMERKEEHTGVCTIESRQHIDDIPNHLQSQTGSESWRYISFPAHSDECALDPDVIDGHDGNGCVLFPEVRSYRWLMARKQEAEELGLMGRYELRYLQKAVAIEGLIFDLPRIKENALDRSRGLGLGGIVPSGTMIGGLDPAPRGNQAAFGWLWTPQTTYMIDLEVQRGGGALGALAVMRRWHVDYGLDTWVYEDNLGKQDFFTRPDFISLKAELNLTVLPHTTGRNKHDPELGISSMAPWYHTGRFNLPYGTAEARRKVNMLLRQLELWTTDGINKRGKSDIKMASWFPFPRMQKWSKEERPKRVVHVDDDMLGTSYPLLGGMSDLNEVPW